VHEVERRERQYLLDGAADIDRRRRRTPAPLQREQLSDPQHSDPAVGVEQGLRVLARRPDQPPRLPHERCRAGRREHEHPMPAARQLLRERGDERIDLVLVLPGARCDLRDREPLRHRAEVNGWH
jgi:hypothetical protein